MARNGRCFFVTAILFLVPLVLLLINIINYDHDTTVPVPFHQMEDVYKDKTDHLLQVLGTDAKFVNVSYVLQKNGTNIPGKPIRVPKEVFDDVMSVNNFINLTTKLAGEFVFLTAADSSHFGPSLRTIATMQIHHPKTDIYYYDLGLTPKQVQQLNTICLVHVRKFNFTKYPRHLKNLHNYAWKNIIDYEMIREFPGVFWMDAEVRLARPLPSTAHQDAVDSHGFIFNHIRINHSNYAVTHPMLYNFLPTDISAMKLLKQRESGSIRFYRTSAAYRSVLRWFYMCAFDPLCAEPTTQVTCNLNRDRFNIYCGCHRYDQSLLNILVQNYVGYSQTKSVTKEIFDLVDRGVWKLPAWYKPPETCLNVTI